MSDQIHRSTSLFRSASLATSLILRVCKAQFRVYTIHSQGTHKGYIYHKVCIAEANVTSTTRTSKNTHHRKGPKKGLCPSKYGWTFKELQVQVKGDTFKYIGGNSAFNNGL